MVIFIDWLYPVSALLSATMPSPENYYPIWKVFLLFAVYPLPNPYIITASGKAHLFWFLWHEVMLAVSCLLIAHSYWQREAIFYYAIRFVLW
jgi:hypothetical protein